MSRGRLPWGSASCGNTCPAPLGHRWRERDRQKRAGEDADRLAGRLRYASVQAVDTAARTWARDIDSGWRSLSDSLGSAVVRAEQAAGSSTESAYLIEMSAQIATIREALREVADPSRMGAVRGDLSPTSPERTHR